MPQGGFGVGRVPEEGEGITGTGPPGRWEMSSRATLGDAYRSQILPGALS